MSRSFERIGKQLDNLGLGRTAVNVRGVDDNPISADPAVRQKGVDAARAVLDCCAAAGVETLAGPCYAALGEFSGAPPTADEWAWGVESVRKMAEHAGEVGVRIAVEPLNRFEIYLLNSHADGARFVSEVDHPNCCLMYDTFHANIEEKSIPDAINACSSVLGHVHICENDRSVPGTGGVNWPATFEALHRVGYDGWMVCEAFGQGIPEVAAATRIWRRMFDSEMQLARDALTFMQAEVAKRWK